MIWATGDCHGDFRRFSMDCFPEQREMDKQDMVLVTGDFGGVWNYQGEDKEESYWLKWLNNKSFTTAFADGNHECFPRLELFREQKFGGGRVHEIRPSIFHMMRGEVFVLEGKTFFVFGGAASHDVKDGILDPVKDQGKIRRWRRDREKEFRVNGRNWWQQELPSEEEMENGRRNLRKYEYHVDFVISHDGPWSVVEAMFPGNAKPDRLTGYFDELLREGLTFDKWIFGHHHENRQYQNKYICLYEQIIRLV